MNALDHPLHRYNQRRYDFRLVWLIVLMLFSFTGCGGGGGTSGSATIGTSGGTVTDDSGAQVIFPAKALSTDTTVRIAKDSTGTPPLPAAATAAGAVYKITPHGGDFEDLVEVIIPVDQTSFAENEQLLLVTARPGDTAGHVLSGATYSNGKLRAPVMHFSFFQPIVVTNLYVPQMVTSIDDQNNVGADGATLISADFQIIQPGHYLVSRLRFPAPPPKVYAPGSVPAPSPQVCLPTSYGPNGAEWRFLRNGNQPVAPYVEHWDLKASRTTLDNYPRFENEIDSSSVGWSPAASPVAGFGALHFYGQDNPRRGTYANGYALPPDNNDSGNDLLTWRGSVEFDAIHNGRMRVDVTVPTNCGLFIEAVPLAFQVNVVDPYTRNNFWGVSPEFGNYETYVNEGQSTWINFEKSGFGSVESVTWEFSQNMTNWVALPQSPTFNAVTLDNLRWKLNFPSAQATQNGYYRAHACTLALDGITSYCVNGFSALLNVVSTPPTFSSTPVSQTILAGETASFTVIVDGVPTPNLQWQKRSLIAAAFGYLDWSDIDGATGWEHLDLFGGTRITTTYTTPITVPGDNATQFRVLATNAYGVVASDIVYLTVVDQYLPPVIQSQPGNLNVSVGGTAVFAATVSGTEPLSYQWRRNEVDITGANSAILTLSNVSGLNDGLYDLVVTNNVGTVTSDPATLLVTLGTPVSLPPTIAAPPASISVASGNAANFAVAVNGTGPYTYMWMKNGVQTALPGGDSASFGIASVTDADAGTYSVRVTNDVGTVVSAAATLTVTPATGVPVAPTISTGLSSLVVLPGAGATFAVAVTGTGPFTYQWRLNGAVIAGAVDAVLHISSAGAADVGQYAVEVSNSAGVASSNSVQLIVIGLPTISVQPVSKTTSVGTPVTFNVVALGDGLLYQWALNDVAIPDATSASYTTPAPTLADDGAIYKVIVYNGAGLVISNGAVLTSVAVPTWQGATLIEVGTGNLPAVPSMAMDANGDAFAIWVQSGGGSFPDIWVDRYLADTGWETAALMETSDTLTGVPSIAIQSNGNAIAVWPQDASGWNSIWVSTYVVGSGWTTPALLETGNAGHAYAPNIAIDPNGNAVAVWSQSDGTRLNIWSNYYVAGSGWGSATLVENDTADGANYPKVAMDANGNAIVVWAQSDGFRNNAWTNRYVVGTGWGTPELLETENLGSAGFPSIAMDNSGNAFAVWGQWDGLRNNVWANRYLVDTGWGTAALLETDNAGDATPGPVVMDANGNAMVAWSQSDGTNINAWANRYVAGTGWGTAALLETDNSSDVGIPSIAMNASGAAVAVWHQSDGTLNSIWANHYAAGSGWGTPLLIETDNTYDAIYPGVVMSASGSGIATWVQGNGSGNNNVWANVFK